MLKRIFSLLLCCAMLAGYILVPSIAEELPQQDLSEQVAEESTEPAATEGATEPEATEGTNDDLMLMAAATADIVYYSLKVAYRTVASDYLSGNGWRYDPAQGILYLEEGFDSYISSDLASLTVVVDGAVNAHGFSAAGELILRGKNGRNADKIVSDRVVVRGDHLLVENLSLIVSAENANALVVGANGTSSDASGNGCLELIDASVSASATGSRSYEGISVDMMLVQGNSYLYGSTSRPALQGIYASGTTSTFSSESHVEASTRTGSALIAKGVGMPEYAYVRDTGVYGSSEFSLVATAEKYPTGYVSTARSYEFVGLDHVSYQQNADGQTHAVVCGCDTYPLIASEPCSGRTAICGKKPVCDYCGSEYGEVVNTDHEFDAATGACKHCGLPGGTCGTGVNWKLEDGVLTIFGSGAMKSYASINKIYGSIASIDYLSKPWAMKDVAKVVVEQGVTTVGNGAFFAITNSLAEVSLADSITYIGDLAFSGCVNLKQITFPENVTRLGELVFEDCSGLNTVHFTGNAPAFASNTFTDVTATCYYPAGDSTWTANVLQNYGGNLTWVALCYDGHSWVDATCVDPKTCANCGATEGTVGTHSYEAVVTDPTCTEQGCTTYTCTGCGDSYVEDYKAILGHSFKNNVCTVCGARDEAALAIYYGRSALAALENGEVLRYAYDQIAAGVENCTEEINIYNGVTYLSPDELSIVMDAYIRDYTGHFWLGNSWSYTYPKNAPNNVISVIPSYNMTGSELEAAKTAFNTAAEEILSGITDSMSDYEKELYLHDTLASRIVYKEGTNAHNAYGALVGGVAVCEGYAEAFQYLLQQVGIQSFIITGKSNDQAHAWNAVKIGGNFYHVDLTWDDQGEDLYHAYFNVTDARIMEDHTIYAAGYALPTCNSEEAFYFTGKETLLTSYSTEDVGALLKANNDKVHVYLPSGEVQTFLDWYDANIVAIATQAGVSGRFSYVYSNLGREVILEIHSYEAVITPPTCTAGGYTTYTCSRCSDTYTDDEAAALDHVPGEAVIEEIVGGYPCQHDEVVYCENCGEELSRKTVETLWGDINCDGEVDSMDAYLILQYDAELITADSLHLEVADVSGDGEVDSMDAYLILQYDAELITAFPVEGK